MGREVAAEESPSLTGEVIGETHRGLEHAQAHPPTRESALDQPSLIVAKGVTEIRQRVEEVPLPPLGPSPMYSITAQ